MSTIQLAKGYNPKKLTSRVFMSEKLDGVPVRIDVTRIGNRYDAVATSRQGKDVPSVHFIVRDLCKIVASIPQLQREGTTDHFIFVGEVTHDTYTDFKDISGVVRTQEPSTALRLNLFDFVDMVFTDDPFCKRWFALQYLFEQAQFRSEYIRLIPHYKVQATQIDDVFDRFMSENPKAEGMIVRDYTGKFQAGKRTWCYQKLIKDPTIDLHIVGCEEATGEDGSPLGMAGRLVASYKGRTIGVGPGKLTHAERKQVLDYFKQPHSGPRMATIKHKADDSYNDLRQPTFQHWRDDKDTPDA